MAPDTRNRIRETARRLFLSRGYTATSMRLIADESGVGKASIYHYFTDKQSLLMALVNGSIEGMDIVLSVIRGQQDPVERIRTAVSTSIRFLYETVDIISIVRRELPDGKKALMKQFIPFMHEYLELISEALRYGTEQGLFRTMDPDRTARVLLTMVQGTFAMAYVTGEKAATPDQTTEMLLDVFFKGIEK